MNASFSAHERAAARSIAAWVHRETPDELGTLVDSIWSLAKAAPIPELADHARSLMEHGLNGEQSAGDPKTLVALAALLEDAAGTLRAAARILERSQ